MPIFLMQAFAGSPYLTVDSCYVDRPTLLQARPGEMLQHQHSNEQGSFARHPSGPEPALQRLQQPHQSQVQKLQPLPCPSLCDSIEETVWPVMATST